MAQDIKATFEADSSSLTSALNKIKDAAGKTDKKLSDLNETVDNVTVITGSASEATEKMSDSVDEAGDTASFTDEQFDTLVNTFQDITEQSFQYKSSQDSADESTENLGDSVSKLTATISTLNKSLDEATTDSGMLTVAQKATESQLNSTQDSAEEMADSMQNTSASLFGVSLSSIAASTGLKAAKESLDEAGDEADDAAGDFTKAAGAAELLSLQSSALSINVGLFTIALRNLTTQIPLLVSSLGNLTAAFTGLASVVAGVGFGGFAVALGGALATAEDAGANLDDFESVMQSLEPVSQDVQEALVDAFMPVVEAQGSIELFESILGTVINTVSEFSTVLANTFEGGILADSTSEMQSLRATTTQILESVNDNVGDIAAAFGRLTLILGDDITQILDMALEGLPGFLRGVTTATEEVLDIVGDATGGIGKFINQLTQLGRTIAAGVAPVLSSFFSVVAKFVDQLVLTQEEINNFNGSLEEARKAQGAFKRETIATAAKMAALLVAANRIAAILGSLVGPVTKVTGALIGIGREAADSGGALAAFFNTLSRGTSRVLGISQGITKLAAAFEQILPPIGKSQSNLSQLGEALAQTEITTNAYSFALAKADENQKLFTQNRIVSFLTELGSKFKFAAKSAVGLATATESIDFNSALDFDVASMESFRQESQISANTLKNLRQEANLFENTDFSSNLDSNVNFGNLVDPNFEKFGEFDPEIDPDSKIGFDQFVTPSSFSVDDFDPEIDPDSKIGFAEFVSPDSKGITQSLENVDFSLALPDSKNTITAKDIIDADGISSAVGETFDFSDEVEKLEHLSTSADDVMEGMGESFTFAMEGMGESFSFNPILAEFDSGIQGMMQRSGQIEGILSSSVRPAFEDGLESDNLLTFDQDDVSNPLNQVNFRSPEALDDPFEDVNFNESVNQAIDEDIVNNAIKDPEIDNISLSKDELENTGERISEVLPSEGGHERVLQISKVEGDPIKDLMSDSDKTPVLKSTDIVEDDNLRLDQRLGIDEKGMRRKFNTLKSVSASASDTMKSKSSSAFSTVSSGADTTQQKIDSLGESVADTFGTDVMAGIEKADDLGDAVNSIQKNVDASNEEVREMADTLQQLHDDEKLAEMTTSELENEFEDLSVDAEIAQNAVDELGDEFTEVSAKATGANAATSLLSASAISLSSVFTAIGVAVGVLAGAFVVFVGVVGVAGALLAKLGESGKSLKELLNDLKNAAIEVGKAALPFVTSAADLVLDTFNTIVEIGSELISVFTDIGVELGLIEESSESGKGGFEGFLQTVKSVSKEVATLLDDFGNFVRLVGGKLIRKIRGAGKAFVAFLDKIDAKEKLNSASNVLSDISDAVGGIEGAMQTTITIVEAFISGLIKTAFILGVVGVAALFAFGGLSGVLAALTGIVGIIGGLVGGLVSIPALIVGAVAALIVLAEHFGLLDGIIKLIMIPINMLIDLTMALVNVIIGLFESIASLINLDTIIGVIVSIFDVIGQSIMFVIDIFSTLFDAIIRIGTAIGNILLTAYLLMIVGVFNEITDAIDSAREGFNRFLEKNGLLKFVEEAQKFVRGLAKDIMALPTMAESFFAKLLRGFKEFLNGFINSLNSGIERLNSIASQVDGVDTIDKVEKFDVNQETRASVESANQSGQSAASEVTESNTEASNVKEGSRFGSDAEEAGAPGQNGDVTVEEGDTTNIFNQTISADPEDEVQIGRIAEDAMAEANSFKRRQQGSQ